jgi:glycosyltransferase involved in cell wall biosynthesis
VVCTLHGWHYRRLADRIERTIERLGLYGCAQITAPNSLMITQLPVRLRRRAQVVPNGVVPVGPTLRAIDNDVHVMWLGRVCQAKGIEIALEAFLGASRRVPNLKLHIVGPLEEPNLQGLLSVAADRAAGRISLWGTVQRPWQEVPADILLHTALYDACPRDILEAMSAGATVVSTAVGGIPEVIDHNRDGLLTSASNVPELVDHLVRLATDAELRGQLSAAALARFEAHYRIDAMAERFSNLYEIAFGS